MIVNNASAKDFNAAISEALAVLKSGGLILYPTDTVWGIGCDATNEEAVQKVFALKRRSEAKSLVLLACDLDMVARYIRKIPPIAVDLVEVNDAPMTIVYPGAIVAGASGAAAFGLAPSIVAADGSVGIRIPHVPAGAFSECPVKNGRKCKTPQGLGVGGPSKTAKNDGAPSGDWAERPASAGAVFCSRLVYRLRRPLVSTSANISGEAAPSDFAAISPEIRAGVDYVVPAALSFPAGPRAAASGPCAAAPGSRTPAMPGSDRATRTPATVVRFDDSATGRPSQILKLGLDGEVEIIRP